MIHHYQLMSKQFLQMDNTTTCHHPLIQGPQTGHGCLRSLCHFLVLKSPASFRARGDYWHLIHFSRKCVLPCILQDSLQKSLGQLGTHEGPSWEERWSVAKAAGLFFAQGYCANRRECIKRRSCTATLLHMHFEPSYHTIDVSLIVSSFSSFFFLEGKAF